MPEYLGLATGAPESLLKRFHGWVLVALLCLSWASAAQPFSAVNLSPPNVAFYYQSDLPVDLLQAFDQVVVDPASITWAQLPRSPHTEWVARVSLGDADAESAVDWENTRMEPLWSQGYRAFYLDDGLPQVAISDASMAQRLSVLEARHPEVRVWLHRHENLLATQVTHLGGWVVDSLFRHYDFVSGSFLTLTEATRNEALAHLQGIHEQYPNLNIIDLEICESNDLSCRRGVAQSSGQAGLTPFVSDPQMGTVGIGRIEVMPRRILVVQSLGKGEAAETGTGARVLSMPLDYLGYDIQFANVNEELPARVSTDRYAGVVVYFNKDAIQSSTWKTWFLNCLDAGLHVAVFDQFGFDISPDVASRLGLTLVGGQYPVGSKAVILHLDSMMGFERNPHLDEKDPMGLENASSIRLNDSHQSLARVEVAGQQIDMAGITDWGGYTLAPFSMESLSELDMDYWVINPVEFLKRALRLPDMPVPDVTTENGRRLFFVQVDGDGFASHAEFSGHDYGTQALYEEVFKKYPVPTTVSVVEGEVGPQGKYPQLSPTFEAIARKIFALPNVEIGSHGYAHPLDWVLADPQYHQEAEQLSLHLPGYHFNVDREIRGSIDYINQHLAPPGKKVKVMQWTGAANPTARALQTAYAAGVYNINGGDTVITNSDNSWTQIGGVGIAKGEGDENYQVYAAQMNENIYTHDWIRPFYGMVRVLETFRLTETPVRLKPVDLYYHFYSGTKLASLKALQNVYDVILRQPVFPIYTSDYAERVLEARHATVARSGKRWILRTGMALREFRLPAGELPDMQTAHGLLGYLATPGGEYLHLGADQASFEPLRPSDPPNHQPYLAAAAAFVENFQRSGDDLRMRVWGYYHPYLIFENATHCSFYLDGDPVQMSEDTKHRAMVRFPGNVSGKTLHDIKVHCAPGT